MKSLTYVLKITAISLNTYFSAWLLLFVCSGYGGHPLSLYACLSSILICAVPPVTLITIALTFHKNLKILNSVLRIIAIISRRPASSVFSPILRVGLFLPRLPAGGAPHTIISTFTSSFEIPCLSRVYLWGFDIRYSFNVILSAQAVSQ